MAKLSTMKADDIVYNEPKKTVFHREAKKALKDLAKKLGLDSSEYDLRSNKGGIAVTGEITLHTDKLYVQISGDVFGGGLKILYRTCKGRKDYSGGQNNFADVSKLEDGSLLNKLASMA